MFLLEWKIYFHGFFKLKSLGPFKTKFGCLTRPCKVVGEKMDFNSAHSKFFTFFGTLKIQIIDEIEI